MEGNHDVGFKEPKVSVLNHLIMKYSYTVYRMFVGLSCANRYGDDEPR